MRILQLIDSLEAGGAEKMAVNYANALVDSIDFSGLIATRKEGMLKQQINEKVNYLFLKKSRTIDFKAISKLYNYCKKNQISHIQAHSSSYFMALFVKIFIPKLKIIWHIHNGNFTNKSFSNIQLIKFYSFFFHKIISVNKEINSFVFKNISKNSIYLQNFSISNKILKFTSLKGFEYNKILQIANLKHPKNHLFTINIAKEIILRFPNWTFHLVGKDFNNDYSNELKTRIKSLNLENHVFIYGSKSDIENIISQADICILTSESEGLPVALIEYGMQKKPVVATAVGEIPNMIINQKNGYLAPSNNVDVFVDCLSNLIQDDKLRLQLGSEFYHTIERDFSEKNIIQNYLKFIK